VSNRFCNSAEQKDATRAKRPTPEGGGQACKGGKAGRLQAVLRREGSIQVLWHARSPVCRREEPIACRYVTEGAILARSAETEEGRAESAPPSERAGRHAASYVTVCASAHVEWIVDITPCQAARPTPARRRVVRHATQPPAFTPLFQSPVATPARAIRSAAPPRTKSAVRWVSGAAPGRHARTAMPARRRAPRHGYVPRGRAAGRWSPAREAQSLRATQDRSHAARVIKKCRYWQPEQRPRAKCLIAPPVYRTKQPA
jgi:hypothetical protein